MTSSTGGTAGTEAGARGLTGRWWTCCSLGWWVVGWFLVKLSCCVVKREEKPSLGVLLGFDLRLQALECSGPE